MGKKCITDINVRGKKCLVRVDYNVPLDENGNITSDNRITATLPTINYLLNNGASVILMSHLGRPNGKVKKEFSLECVSKRLSQLLSKEVLFAPDCLGEQTKKTAKSLKTGQVLLLENLRFYAEEEANDDIFAKELASYGDIYVNDAFGTAHRAHASTAGIAKYCSVKVSGLLVEKELAFMGNALDNPTRPFVAILGGAKVSDKIGVIKNLLGKVDALLIGGAMSYTFMKAEGKEIGLSLCEYDKIELASQLLSQAKERGVDLVLPVDHVAANRFDNDAEKIITCEGDIPLGFMGLDIGQKSVKLFESYIEKAKTIVWNGPLGAFEMPNFSFGTFAVAKAVANSGAMSVIGGGDSASAVKKAGVAKQITHISTGGGASLEYLEGLILPGIDCLDDK